MASGNELDRFRADVGAIVAKHEATKSATNFTKYAEDPVGFLRDVLKCNPWEMQVAIAELVRQHPRVCVVSANSMGKDWLIARLFLWWVYARNGLVIATSVTDRQARRITMVEVRRAFLSTPSLPGELFQMELRVSDNAGILAFTSDSIEKLVGFHHPRLMLALSEGQGLDAQVFEAAHACATASGNKIIVYGNPTVVAGAFHNAATSANWQTLTISAFQHPNIVHGREEIPGGPSVAWIESMAEEYGKTSSQYRSRVLSEWPDESIEGLLKRSWLLAAFQRHADGTLDAAAFRYRPPNATDAWRPLTELEAAKYGYSPLLSIDPSRYGADSSVCAVIRGHVVESLTTWHGASLTDSADIVLGLIEQHWTNRLVAPPRVVVDGVGLGAGLVDVLRRARVAVVDYNGGSRSILPRLYLNRRAADHWALRTALEAGTIALPRDELLLEEALSVEWQTAPLGQIQIVSKDDIRKALGRSPDRLDAVVAGLSLTLPPPRGALAVVRNIVMAA